MEFLHILALLAPPAIAGILLLGWRDDWFGRAPALNRKGRPSDPPTTSEANFVGIAEIARFGAMRRRIGYHSANHIIRTLAERVAHDDRFEVGRLGRTSVEFLFRAESPEEARAMMRVLKQMLETLVSVDTIAFEPEIIIGAYPIAGNRLHDELFDMAAFAVEDARKLSERISFADDRALPAASPQSANMLHNLYDAIKGNALDLHYMPKLKLSDNTVASAEALCRWTHPEHGSVPPMMFVRLAEETGLIADLTVWTLDRAIADQARLLADEGIALAIDVNMSAQLISNAEFCDLVIERICQAKGRVGIEITETAVIEEPDAALGNLSRIAAAGVRIAIDDFGSGLSSLTYLRDLPAHELKIDQAFVRALTTSNRDPLLVRSAIDIAHALEMEVTAEGVEDEIALALLKVMRCDNVQGYHISMPLSFDHLTQYLRASAHRTVLGDEGVLRSRLLSTRTAS